MSKVVRIDRRRAAAPPDELSKAVDAWLDALAFERGASPHTVHGYRTDVGVFRRWLKSHLGHHPTLADLAALSPTDFRAWLKARADAGCGTSSRARYLAALRGLYRYLDDEGLGSERALRKIKTPRRRRPLPRPLTLQQIDAVVSEVAAVAKQPWIGLRDRAVLVLLYASGLRISEALGLNREQAPDPARDGSTLRILGKGDKERIVPVPAIAAEAIAQYLGLCPRHLAPTDPLFVTAAGARMSPKSIQARMRELRDPLGLGPRATPHAMRHSFATHILDGSGNIRAVQELLGHASISTTERYTQVETSGLVHLHETAHPWGAPTDAERRISRD